MRLHFRNISTRRFWVILIILVIISILSCGPSRAQRQANFDNMLGSLVGKDINDVIRKLGYPQRVNDMPNGNKLYTFAKGKTVQDPVVNVPGQTTYNQIGNTVYKNQQPGYTIGGGTSTYYCILNFEVNEDNAIVHTQYEGNRCY
jgi:hypothetical protein